MTNRTNDRTQTKILKWTILGVVLATVIGLIGLWSGGVLDAIFSGPPPSALIGPSLDDGKGDVCGKFFMTPSGVTLKKGDQFEITATGEICWEKDTLCGNPDSDVVWGLYYRIGANGDILKAGSSLSDVAYSDGELYLVIPEKGKVEYQRSDKKFYLDNVGCFTVEVVAKTR